MIFADELIEVGPAAREHERDVVGDRTLGDETHAEDADGGDGLRAGAAAVFHLGVEDGEIVGTVRNPGYRGISATFWRNLKGVGDHNSFKVMGTANCGKGELNQAIGTGHASPACLFSDVDVFGGAA